MRLTASLEVSPDGTVGIVKTYSTALLFDLVSHALVRRIETAPGASIHCAFSDAGERVGILYDHRKYPQRMTARVIGYDGTDHAILAGMETGSGRIVFFDHDGRELWTQAGDGPVHVLRCRHGRAGTEAWAAPGRIRQVSADGRRMLLSVYRPAVYERREGSLELLWERSLDSPSSTAVMSSDGRLLAMLVPHEYRLVEFDETGREICDWRDERFDVSMLGPALEFLRTKAQDRYYLLMGAGIHSQASGRADLCAIDPAGAAGR